MKKEHNKEIQTTGHEWDGITEYKNPDPFWLRALFYCALFFAIFYWLLYPSFPVPKGRGILDWSAGKEALQDLNEKEKVYSTYKKDFDQASFAEILQNKKLLKFALAGGRSAFQNNCAVCHGSGGGGNTGYPNLLAGAWIWGGQIDDIYTTLLYGIRSGHEEARESLMAAFGADNILNAKEIHAITNYIMNFNNNSYEDKNATKLFAKNCSSCHGADGYGNKEFGAPNLRDAIWLYGKDYETIYDVIYNGRGGVMPYWHDKLSNSTIRQLAIYVYQLSAEQK